MAWCGIQIVEGNDMALADLNDPVIRLKLDVLRPQLEQTRQWYAQVTGLQIGGGPFNTEGLRLLLASQLQLLEVLIEGKVTTQLPSRHHV